MAKLSKKAAPKAKTATKKATKVDVKKVEEPVVAQTVETKAVKEEPKKIAAKEEPKKISAKEEAKKITAAKEPEKIAVAKEPEKIAAKAEPKKLETAAEVVEEKPVKKAPAKKRATKKAEPKEESKAAKKETAPKAVKKAEDKATKKAETKTAKKAEEKPVKKAAAKKPAKKAVDQEKLDAYNALPVEECIRLMQVMQVHYGYEDYYNLLLDEPDLTKLAKNIIEGNKINEQNYNFEETGCDVDLVMVTLVKVGETMDIKAADYKELKKQVTKALKFTMSEDAEVNAAEYLDEFKLSEKLLMIGQRKSLFNAVEVGALIDADVVAYFKHFFDFAYALLPTWQYNDVKFYEDFAYAVLSQYADLFETEQLRIQLDVADLYIKHGDYQQGDELYGYILRDNQIKDYIYYRYASVYTDIDYNKAKSIAYSSLQYVDDRFTFYPNIMDIVNN